MRLTFFINIYTTENLGKWRLRWKVAGDRLVTYTAKNTQQCFAIAAPS